MKLTSLDIQIKEFGRSLRGYDVDEVKDFLEKISKQVESLDFENKVLRDKLREKELIVIEFKEREAMLKDTMITAQRVTEGIKKDATRESLHIITQAKMKADGIIREARQSIKKTIDEINKLKEQKMEIISRTRAILETHLRMINRHENEDDMFMELDIPHDTFPTLTLRKSDSTDDL